jgi:hypothetical protein
MMTPVAVVIVNYNTCELLRPCLATLQSEAPTETIVVDNASSDGSAEMVRSDFPWVLLQANTTNRGYGAAANQAMAGCTAKYVLLLNSDTRLQPGALESLSAYLDQHPQAAIVGPRIVNLDGTLQPSCYPFPTVLNTLFVNSHLGHVIRSVPGLRDRYLPAWSHSHARVVPWVLGAALAIRRQAFESVAGFDEAFFLYYEEVDLCYRLYAAGWQVHFAPVTTVVHVGAASTSQQQTDMAVQMVASTMRFYRKHYSIRRQAQLVSLWRAIMLIRWVWDTARLGFTRHAGQRTRIAAGIAAWRRVLLERRPGSMDANNERAGRAPV